jgi:ethanolamine ammonia-lyase large subunit
MARLIEEQNDPDKIVEAVESMVDKWTLEELKDYVLEDQAEYFLGKDVSEDEVKELVSKYGG